MRGFAASGRLPSMPSNFRQRNYSYTPGNFWRGFSGRKISCKWSEFIQNSLPLALIQVR